MNVAPLVRVVLKDTPVEASIMALAALQVVTVAAHIA
jgi:hypothetical protein